MQVSVLPNRVISETLRKLLAKVLPEALPPPDAAQTMSRQSTKQMQSDPKPQLPMAVPVPTTFRHDADLAKNKWPIVEVSPKYKLLSEIRI